MAVEKFTDLPAAVPLTTDITAFVDDPGGGSEQSAQCTISQLVPALSIDAGKIASNAVTTAKILDANVTLAKMANLAEATVIGRAAAAGTGVPTALTAAQLATIIGIPTGVSPAQNGYRLSLTTAVPVTTADVTAAGTIYWVPYKGNWCSIYNGSSWSNYNGGQLSLSLTATSGNVYDLFLDYNSGTPQLVSLVWTNTTTRATALAYQDGVLVKSGTATQRYLGTFRASGSNVTEDSGGGVTTLVGAKRYLWNYYNRVRRSLNVFDGTDTWATAVGTRQADANAGNQVDFVVGVDEDIVEAEVNVEAISSASNAMAVAIGLDSTTTPSTLCWRGGVSTVITRSQIGAIFRGYAGVGHHSLVWLEIATQTTGTWVGDAAATRVQSGLAGSMWA